MIDLSLLRPSRLEHTPPGVLFIPVVETGGHFLAGRINDFSVLVELDGEEPFHVAETETWSRSAGLVVEGGRFQVDPQSAIPVRSASDAPPGALVLTRTGPSLLAHDRNGAKAVLLAGGKGPTDIEAGDVAFSKWRIVTGAGDAQAVHFQQPPA